MSLAHCALAGAWFFACAAGYTSGAGAESANKRPSSFKYVDEKDIGKKQYVAPIIGESPTDLTIEEMRSRILNLEDRIEYLERIVTHGRRSTVEPVPVERPIAASAGDRP